MESATEAILSGTRKLANSPNGGMGRYLVATSGMLAMQMPANVPITPSSAPRTKLRPAVKRVSRGDGTGHCQVGGSLD